MKTILLIIIAVFMAAPCGASFSEVERLVFKDPGSNFCEPITLVIHCISTHKSGVLTRKYPEVEKFFQHGIFINEGERVIGFNEKVVRISLSNKYIKYIRKEKGLGFGPQVVDGEQVIAEQWLFTLGTRKLKSISYKNSFDENFGVKIRVYAMTFSYTIEPSGLPATELVAPGFVYQGKVRASKNPEDGKWELKLELNDLGQKCFKLK